jgi:predicted RNA-binding Zn ribbon-like protein
VDFDHCTDEPMRMAMDLVNTYDQYAAEEQLRTPGDVVDFLNGHPVHWPEVFGSVANKDLLEIRALRSRLRDVFSVGDEGAAARLLNKILAEVAAMPRVSVHAGAGPHLHFEPMKGSPAGWLGAVAAMGLSIVLVEDGLDRFGICNSSTCDDVFVDTSRNRSRRHCSDTCTTRENVAAYRERQKAEN